MLKLANSVENGASNVRIGSYNGAWYTERKGNTLVTVSQILMEWVPFFVRQDNIWQTIALYHHDTSLHLDRQGIINHGSLGCHIYRHDILLQGGWFKERWVFWSVLSETLVSGGSQANMGHRWPGIRPMPSDRLLRPLLASVGHKPLAFLRRLQSPKLIKHPFLMQGYSDATDRFAKTMYLRC